ncbi:MAG: hypothetical protein ABSH53_04280 [Holophaga sp.]|jgi:hypothetical protein
MAKSNQQNDNLNFYVYILEEIKARIEILNMAMNGRMGTGLTPPFLREISYLQLRMMCELVAIGCISAHGDLESTKSNSIQKEYAADKIIKRLEKLHPDFYPHPVKLTINTGNVNMERVEAGHLSKAELINLYHECGEKLHRGKLGSFKTTSDKMKQPDLSDVFEWGRKFIALLNQHHIASKDNLSHYVCVLNYQELNNHACVWIAQSPLPK